MYIYYAPSQHSQRLTCHVSPPSLINVFTFTNRTRYRRALELMPNYPEARNNLAHLLWREGKPEEAQAGWVEVLRHFEAEGATMDAEKKAGRRKGGESVLNKQQRAGVHVNLAMLLKTTPLTDMGGDNREAERELKANLRSVIIDHYMRADALAPNFMNSRVDLAVYMMDGGAYGAAIPHFRNVISDDPTNHLAHFNLGVSMLHSGKEEAEPGEQGGGETGETGEKGEKGEKEGGGEKMTVSVATVRQVIVHATRAVELQPQFVPGHFFLAQIYDSMGEHSDAQEHIETVRNANHGIS